MENRVLSKKFFSIIFGCWLISGIAHGGVLSVPIDTTQQLILPANTGNIFVASGDIVNTKMIGDKLAFVTGKKIGNTNIFFLGGHDEVLGIQPVNVVMDTSNLQRAIKKIAPDSKIQVISVGNSVVLKGTLSSADTAADIKSLAQSVIGSNAQLIDLMQIKKFQQIYLQVKVVEMSREMINRIGLNNWELLFKTASSAFMIGSSPSSGSSLSVNGNNYNLVGLIDMLNRKGMLNIISEPNLVAAPGQKASFLAGGEFPIIVPFSANNNAQNNTVQFKKYGVSLNFLPTLVGADVINLQVSTEVSDLSKEGQVEVNGINVPGLKTRQATTTVQVKSGQSFAIAGLVKQTTGINKTQVPVLGDIPYVGRLFRSTESTQQEDELVIIVTPYLVNPTSAHLATPNQGISTSQLDPKQYQLTVNQHYLTE